MGDSSPRLKALWPSARWPDIAWPKEFWPKELSLQSLRGRLALLLALAFLPAGAIALQSGFSALATRHAAIQGEEGVRTLRGLNEARDEVTQLRESVRTLAANAALFTQDQTQCEQTLTEFARGFPDLTAVTVLDEHSTVLCASVAELEGRRASAQPLIAISAARGDAAVGFVPTPALGGPPVIGAVAPVAANGDGRRLFVGLTRALDPLMRDIERGQTRDGGFVALLSRNGSVLSAIGLEPESVDSRRLEAMFADAPESALSSAFFLQDRWAIATPVEEGTLYLVEGWAARQLGWEGLLRAAWALLAPVLLWLGAIGATWYAVETFVARPLSVVESLARSYARGEDNVAGEEMLRGAPTEIASLKRTLAAMAKTLRGREARLATALQEERALLLEVNHRVKNNLQMVASILSIQARGTADESEARGLARAQDRVQLLALAHQRIYSSGEVRDIALDQLAGDIGRTLIGARGAEAALVRLELDLDSVRASAARAVPLAFLIGESVASILDSMQNGAKIAALRIVLARKDDSGFKLDVSADGDFSAVASAPSLISQRLTGAFARQIGARMSQDAQRPYHVCIEAQPEPESQAPLA